MLILAAKFIYSEIVECFFSKTKVIYWSVVVEVMLIILFEDGNNFSNFLFMREFSVE